MGYDRLMGWRWIAARLIGTSHLRYGGRCEDSLCVREIATEQGNALVAAVSDGAGSAGRGGEGSSLVTRSIVGQAGSLLKKHGPKLPQDEQIWDWIDQARDRIGAKAASEDASPREFAATLICVIATPFETLIFQIGDGAAVVNYGDGWEVPIWPASGEYASTTYFFTDDPAPKLAIERSDRSAQSVALFSDGLERLALRFGDKCAHEPFFDRLFTLHNDLESAGRDRGASHKLRKFLDSPMVNERTDDDKTLVLARRL